MKTKLLAAFLALAFITTLSPRAFSANEESPVTAQQQKVIAYYFHGTARCYACKLIESYTEEAIKTGFAQEIEAGKLEWKAVNTEEPDNRHFINDYSLYTKSVVLSKLNGEEQTSWKNLDQVWHLIRSKPAFITYIQDETRKLLEEEPK
jgi:hypothetical protein